VLLAVTRAELDIEAFATFEQQVLEDVLILPGLRLEVTLRLEVPFQSDAK
jgi:hypothetical protein